MTTRPCPICQQPHTRSVDCHGTPIDGPARKQRAVDWRRAMAALRDAYTTYTAACDAAAETLGVALAALRLASALV